MIQCTKHCENYATAIMLYYTRNNYSLNTKKTTTYDVRNPVPGLGETQKCGRLWDGQTLS
jgi:hypothetical protein